MKLPISDNPVGRDGKFLGTVVLAGKIIFILSARCGYRAMFTFDKYPNMFSYQIAAG